MKIVGYILTTIAIMAYAVILNGWVLSKLWSWFIVAKFGLPVLSIPEAIGIAMVVAHLTWQGSITKNDDEYWKILAKGMVNVTMKPLLTLCFGSIVKLWL